MTSSPSAFPCIRINTTKQHEDVIHWGDFAFAFVFVRVFVSVLQKHNQYQVLLKWSDFAFVFVFVFVRVFVSVLQKHNQ